jgi:integrase
MPKLSQFRITKRAIDALETTRDAIHFDAELRGFAVRTKPSGSKTYLVQYQSVEGRTRRISLGQHGALTPAEARQRAAVILGRVKSGEDPAEDRNQTRKAMTVRQLCEAYLRAADEQLILGKRSLPKKLSTLATDRGRIERHIIPLLSNRKVRDLTPVDITRFMRDVASGKTAIDVKTRKHGRAIVEGGKGTAARTTGLLGGILSYAVSEGIIASNPARGVKRPADERRRFRLSNEQYRVLGIGVEAAERAGEPWQVTAMTRLLALTGCRRGEIESLRWAEVDFESRCFRLASTKTGASVRPLGQAALAILERLPQRGTTFVFPSTRRSKTGTMVNGPYVGLPKAWRRVLKFTPTPSGLDELTPHGLRHAFASVAHDLGLTEVTIAALLGHSAASITSRYVHHLDAALLSAADKVSRRIASFMDEMGAETAALTLSSLAGA